jgi:adenine/guanine/hypoxanthine permease
VVLGLLPGLASWGSMLLAAMLVYVIEQRFLAAALCALVAAAGSWVGLLHARRFTAGDRVLDPGWGPGSSWALGYLAMAMVFSLGGLAGRGQPR